MTKDSSGQKTIAFVFARGGSTGIARKNLQEIQGISLVGRAIQCAQEVREISEVIVSTDDEEIAEEALRYGARVPFMRPPELASNQASEWKAWQHAVSHHSISEFDTFISVPPTAPLRSSEDLRCCLEVFQRGIADMIVTGTESARSPYFNMVKQVDDGFVDVFHHLEAGVIRRQDAPKTYDLTTVAYVASPQYILRAGGVLEGNVSLVSIPRLRAVDVDEPADLETARFYAQHPEWLAGDPYLVSD